MRQNKIIFFILVLLFLGLTELSAQEIVVSSGGSAAGSTGTATYSVGQTFYITSKGTNASIAEGVQQPFEISVVNVIEGSEAISLSYSLYPNPATDFLILKIENDDNLNLSYQLFDINGKVLGNEKIEGSETNISLQNFVSATYFLKVLSNSKEVKLFKIIKN